MGRLRYLSTWPTSASLIARRAENKTEALMWNMSDDEVLAKAKGIGLSTKAPYDQELLRSHKHIREIIDRLSADWPHEAQPAFSFSSIAHPGDK